MSLTIADIETNRIRRQDLRKEIITLTKASVQQELEALSNLIPEGYQIRVAGYTPYFNDGDPCYHEQIVQFRHESWFENTKQHFSDPKARWACPYTKTSSEVPDIIPNIIRLLESLQIDLEIVYETDWRIILQSGKPIVHERYNPEY